MLHGIGHIRFCVEGFEESLTLFLATAIDELHVLFLDNCAIHEHDRTKVPGCRRTENVAAESVLDETGDTARVINMSVGKDQTVNALAMTYFTTISLKGFLALALEQATVEHDPFAVHFEQVLGAGHGTGSAMESDFHVMFLYQKVNRRILCQPSPPC